MTQPPPYRQIDDYFNFLFSELLTQKKLHLLEGNPDMALDFISPNSLATSWAKHGHSFSLRIIRRSGREVARLGIPMIHHFGARDGMVIATLDEFTAGRRACLDYLLRMIRFSRYTVTKDGRTFHYFYRVVDKYIDTYRLLEVC